MMSEVFELGNAIVEFIIFSTYYKSIFPTPNRERAKKRALDLLFLILYCASSMLRLPSYANMLVFCAVSFLILGTLEGKAVKKFFSVLIFLLFILIADIMASVVLTLMFERAYSEIPGDNVARVLGMLMTTFLLFMVSIYMSRIFNKKIKDLPLKYWFFIILCPVLSFMVLLTFDLALISTGQKSPFLAAVPSIALIYINFIIFDFFETYSSKLKLKIMEEMTAKNQENYKILETREREIKILKHDINNHILTLENMLAQNDAQAARQHLDRLKETAGKILSVIYTQNAALDSILNVEAWKAQTEGIKYTVKADIGGDVFVEPNDLCTIFGNLLDNAIEGSRGLENRYIRVSLDIKEDFFKISVENSAKKVEVSKKGKIRTTKENAHLHGYGLESVRSAIGKYSGQMAVNSYDTHFSVNIILHKKR